MALIKTAKIYALKAATEQGIRDWRTLHTGHHSCLQQVHVNRLEDFSPVLNRVLSLIKRLLKPPNGQTSIVCKTTRKNQGPLVIIKHKPKRLPLNPVLIEERAPFWRNRPYCSGRLSFRRPICKWARGQISIFWNACKTMPYCITRSLQQNRHFAFPLHFYSCYSESFTQNSDPFFKKID